MRKKATCNKINIKNALRKCSAGSRCCIYIGTSTSALQSKMGRIFPILLVVDFGLMFIRA